jgi:hypothetical protein
MRALMLPILPLVLMLAGCWGEPREKSQPSDDAGKPARSMSEKRSLDPVSTPIYAGEDAKAKIARAAIGKALQDFQLAEDRNAASLQELVAKGYLPLLPKEPIGYRFDYDPATGAFDVVLKP